MKLKNKTYSSGHLTRFLFIAAVLLPVLAGYQNCSQVEFGDKAYQNLFSMNAAVYETYEDQDLVATPQTFKASRGGISKFQIVSQTSNGEIKISNEETGEFLYRPNPDFFGEDSFSFSEFQEGMPDALVRTIRITVLPANDAPFIITDVISLEMNSVELPLMVEVRDLEDSDARAVLALDQSVREVLTANGRARVEADGQITYTPNTNFRGLDELPLHALDNEGGSNPKKIRLNIGNPFHSVQPAIAARATSCLMCHSKFASDLIVDFGRGGASEFAKNIVSAGTTGPHGAFAHHFGINSGSQTIDPPSWVTSSFVNGAGVIVPAANLPYDLSASFPIWYSERTSAIWTATTYQTHIRELEKSKPESKGRAAHVTPKSEIYIGAPTVSEIRTAARFSGGETLKYWKDSADSAPLAGFESRGTHFENSGEMACDGDLFVDGTVFLKNLRLATRNGCRIQATGPIFVQGTIQYIERAGTSREFANLQLVSARLVSMGVGTSHCEVTGTASAGWYSNANIASPFAQRLSYVANKFYGIVLRNANPASGFELTAPTPADEAKQLNAIATGIAGLEDASCHGRLVHFERLLVNAPQVSSRYTGNFKGLIVTEYPLFALGKFAFEFDPVFQKVPVLPLLNPESILKVK